MASAEHDAVVALLRSAGTPLETERTLADTRAELEAMAAVFPVADDVTVTPVSVADVPCEWIATPDADPGHLLVYLHGGAYTSGSLASHRSLSARLSRACRTRVLAVDYRLAPEHPHPAGLDDALAVYRAVLAEATDPAAVVIAGDSAGGGLTLATLIALRDQGDPLPAGAVLISPWLDLTLSGESMVSLASVDPVLAFGSLEINARRYAGDADVASPLISPLFADLAGLPPLLVLASTADVLVDDARRLGKAAEAAGVDITLVIESDLIHVWPILAGVPEAEATLVQIADWISAHSRRNASRNP